MRIARKLIARKFILLVMLTFVLGIVSSAQQLRLLYDGTANVGVTTPVAKADQAIFKTQVLPDARRAWRSRQNECVGGWEGDPAIRGVAPGSFTKPNSQQKAILYNYCTPAHAYAFNGVAIVEAGRVVAHLAYQSDWQNDLKASPDINQNGLSEILLISGTTNQGTTWATVSPIELSDTSVHKFGFAEVYSDSCGNDERSGGEAWKLSARIGAAPEFYQESYKRHCNQKVWRRVKDSERIDLKGDGTEYRRLK
jgi:hypothetical protein